MPHTTRRTFLGTCLATGLLTCAESRARAQENQAKESGAFPKSARGKAVAATVHPLATEAALQAMRDGGTAIDAIVAAAVTLSVVDGHNSGIGGGCFLLIHSSDGQLMAIDGREKAPAAARYDMFLRDGKPDTKLSQTGPLASGVPGEIAALEKAHRRFGKLPWGQLFRSAIEVAEGGYAVGNATARALQDEQASIQKFPASAAALLQKDGTAWKKGDRFQQPDLAKTMRMIAAHGSEWFYRGEFAQLAAAHLKSLGGIMTQEDFAAYEAKEREPLKTLYRGNTVIGFPPPSSGGIHVAQMLMMLERFPLRDLYRDRPVAFYHVLAEAMKLAFADRAYWLGDSDFAKVPRGLIDQEYARQLAARIDLDRLCEVPRHGTPPQAETNFFSDRKHTTHLTAADEQGNWVAMTATVNTTWGSKVVIPGTGVVLNNQMDDFSIAPGIPNAFGLIGADANAVAGGKRPLSSMSPTLVLGPDQKPRMTCGAAGGPKIINTSLQVVVRCLDLDQNIDEAIASPRIHHQWAPNQLVHEPGLDAKIVNKLEAMGHSMKSIRALAVAQGIQRRQGELAAASDPRVDSVAGSIPAAR